MKPALVVKLGGELAADEAQCKALAQDVATLGAEHRVVLVHGGGPQATALSKALGLQPQQIGGRRVTDRATLDVMKMVLGGQVSIDLCALLWAHGLRCVGLSGTSSGLIDAVKRPPRAVSGSNGEVVDFGYVGDIVGINVDLLEALWAGGFVPVMNSLGVDRQGGVFNINADVAATRVAVALGASLVMTTGGVRGVLRDVNDPTSRIARLTTAEAKQAIANGVIGGGMIPKVEEGLSTLAQGVAAVHILGKLTPGELVQEIREPGAVGTVLLP